MPEVSTTYTTTADAAAVWAALLDSESYSSYMREVREIKIVESGENSRISSWAVLLKGSELEWTEQEDIDHERRRIDFRQIEGDLASFTGYWQVTADASGTTAELYVNFDIGIPMMSEMLNPVAARALEDNSQLILRHISDLALNAGAS
jgi:ribosome-associated toxin RatA of RatAB toxin-antitoxin module